MNTYKTKFLSTIVVLIGLLTGSCKKEFLTLKPDKALVIPSTFKDLQAIADNTAVMTGDTRNGATPLMGELGADDYIYDDNTWLNLPIMEKNCYIWAKDSYAPNTIVNDWNMPYQAVYYANVVLKGIEQLRGNINQSDKDQLTGSVLFYRSYAFFNLLQIFAPQYDSATASNSLGIPLPLSPDVTLRTGRSSLAAAYHQVIDDLKIALQLLPETSLYKTRPCKATVMALLSRIYLITADYDQALSYANAYLEIKSQLLDFNKLNLNINRPIPGITNPETTFYSVMLSYRSTEPPTTLVSPKLYQLYPDDDLRKYAFFKVSNQQISYKLGNYTAGYSYFSGIATGEILLIRAECLVRRNKIEAAIEDLNTLLISRIATATFSPVNASTAEQALALILLERRKELCFRGLRWVDLRRLNKDPKFAVTLTRVIGGNTYTLPHNDARYVYSIPATEIDYNPIEQNVR